MKLLGFPIDKPVKFVSAGHFISNGEWIHPNRTIDTYVLIIGEKGIAHIFEQSNQYQVEAGDILILSPNVPHGGYKPSRDVAYYWFHFQLTEQPPETHIFQDIPAPSGEDILTFPQYVKNLHQEKASILTHQLLHVYESKYANRYAEDYLFTSLLIEISEQFLQNIQNKSQEDSRNFYKICEWIRVNCHTKISLEDVAREFSYNKNYLCRIFKKNIGTTVQEYINQMKISRVKQYLYSTSKSIQEIAFLSGFDDEKYMMRLFKHLEGMTPTQFRNAYSKTHLNIQ